MISCKAFFDTLTESGVSFFTGVPDSLLKDVCAYIGDHAGASAHVVAANEGAALALAAGHYLASGRPGLVYLQNSGLGNIITPLASLADPEIYAIPALLLIGWRGEPGSHDEPQHRKQGRVMLDTLKAMETPFFILPAAAAEAVATTKQAVALAVEKSRPVALVARKSIFEPYIFKGRQSDDYILKREEAIKLVIGAMGVDELRWLRPVRPGDTLRGRSEVIDKKASQSRPEMGIVRNKVTILNQDDKPVLTMIPIAMWRTRPTSG